MTGSKERERGKRGEERVREDIRKESERKKWRRIAKERNVE